MHGLIALQRPLSSTERAKPQPRIHATFHKPVILLYHIIQVLTLPQRTAVGEVAGLLEGLEGWGIGGVLINRDDPWGGRMRCPEGPAEKALGSLGTRVALSKKSMV
jgi:hypothetical protein